MNTITVKTDFFKYALIIVSFLMSFRTLSQDTLRWHVMDDRYSLYKEQDTYSSSMIYNINGDLLFEFDDKPILLFVHFVPESDTGLIFMDHIQSIGGGTFGFIDKSGKIILPPILNERLIPPSFSYKNYQGNNLFRLINNRMALELGGNRYYYINSKGEKVLPKDSTYYTFAYPFEKEGGCARVNIKIERDKWKSFLIDTSGNRLLDNYKDYHLGVVGIHGIKNSTYKETSQYALLYNRSDTVNKFIVLDPSEKEIFSHPISKKKYEYSFYSYLDQRYKYKNKEGFGVICIERFKVDNKEGYNKYIKRESRVISYSGKKLSRWQNLPLESQFEYKKSMDTLLKLNPKITIYENEESEDNWSINDIENKKKYFKNFSPKFKKDYILEVFEEQFSIDAQLHRYIENKEISFLIIDRALLDKNSSQVHHMLNRNTEEFIKILKKAYGKDYLSKIGDGIITENVIRMFVQDLCINSETSWLAGMREEKELIILKYLKKENEIQFFKEMKAQHFQLKSDQIEVFREKYRDLIEFYCLTNRI